MVCKNLINAVHSLQDTAISRDEQASSTLISIQFNDFYIAINIQYAWNLPIVCKRLIWHGGQIVIHTTKIQRITMFFTVLMLYASNYAEIQTNTPGKTTIATWQDNHTAVFMLSLMTTGKATIRFPSPYSLKDK